jgi:hypothetical protein
LFFVGGTISIGTQLKKTKQNTKKIKSSGTGEELMEGMNQ